VRVRVGVGVWVCDLLGAGVCGDRASSFGGCGVCLHPSIQGLLEPPSDIGGRRWFGWLFGCLVGWLVFLTVLREMGSKFHDDRIWAARAAGGV
jgi:membrane associated rhomboid family serine protease